MHAPSDVNGKWKKQSECNRLMKQALLRKGRVGIVTVPTPVEDAHSLLVEVTRSLISTGTEMASIQGSESSLIEKARHKPGAMGKAVDSIRTRGLVKTLAYARARLDESSSLGYSCAGRVLAVGKDVRGFRPGDRVACAGAGMANHAEIVLVPAPLCVAVPEEISNVAASFVTLGAIALQGVRRADARLGETVCVIGLGLIGQLTVQLLAAAGCRVIGMDRDPLRVDLASRHGMPHGANSDEELTRVVELRTGRKGVDVTIITASTPSSSPTQLAFHLTRRKGKIVVVGAVGLELNRSPFYEKEQDFLISCLYGPGRYDASYEREGHDYPYGYVRWTENRNMMAFLELIREKRVDVESLVDKEVALDDVPSAYEKLGDKTSPKPLAVVISYPEAAEGRLKVTPILRAVIPAVRTGTIRLGLIGVGNFAKSTHIPNIEKLRQFKIMGVCTGGGTTAVNMGRWLNAPIVSNDYREIISALEIDAVLVSTRHSDHAEIAQAALKAGKHVYLEKPLALNREELESLDETLREVKGCPVFMVGFNRRYSPFAQALAERFEKRSTPLFINYRVNAGMLPENHWAQTAEGGGRLKGEACHMVDLFRFLVNRPLRDYEIGAFPAAPGLRPDENFAARFTYEDGSICVLSYLAIGNEGLAKEWAEFHWDRKSAVMDDFRSLHFYGCAGGSTLARQDKGHAKALERFSSAIRDGISFPIPWDQLHETTLATIELDDVAWGRLGS